MKPSEILKNAMKLIDTRDKWGKGLRFDGETGAMCLIGAISKAATGVAVSPYENERSLSNIQAVEILGMDENEVIAFNDDAETEHEDVIILLALGIAMNEAAGQ